MKLTDVQRKILSALLQTVGVSVEELAQLTGVRTHLVRYWLKEFTDRGWIRPFYLMNYAPLGLRRFNFFFSLAPEKAPAALKLLRSDPRVVWLTEQNGSPRYELTAVMRDPVELEQLLRRVADEVGALFEDRQWAVEIANISYGIRCFGQLANEPIVKFEDAPFDLKRPIPLSKLDLQLLDLLTGELETRTASTRELAQILQQPSATVAYHLKKLQTAQVISPRVYQLHLDASGSFQCQLVLTLRSSVPNFYDQLQKFSGDQPAVISIIKGFGGWDYKLVIQSTSAGDGLAVRDLLETTFHGVFEKIHLLTRRRIISDHTYLRNHSELACDA